MHAALGRSSSRRLVWKLLLVGSRVALAASACAGGATPPARPSPSVESTRPAAAPTQPADSGSHPALTSMAVILRGKTITPSPVVERSNATPTLARGQMEIVVGDYYFSPQVVTVTVDTTVTWVSVGVLYHTILSKDKPPYFSGATGGVGSPSLSVIFHQPGVYAYHCDYHPGAMDAWVVVVDE